MWIWMIILSVCVIMLNVALIVMLHKYTDSQKALEIVNKDCYELQRNIREKEFDLNRKDTLCKELELKLSAYEDKSGKTYEVNLHNTLVVNGYLEVRKVVVTGAMGFVWNKDILTINDGTGRPLYAIKGEDVLSVSEVTSVDNKG